MHASCRGAVLLTAIVVCSGCRTGRGWFQMDSDSRVPYFNFNLLTISHDRLDEQRPPIRSAMLPAAKPRGFFPNWMIGRDEEPIVPLLRTDETGRESSDLSGPPSRFH